MGRTLRSQNLKLALRSDSGLGIGMVYPLTNKRNVLGRSVDVDVPVEDSKVSRNHASIDLQNGFHYLVDLGSTNGTYLNGKRLATSKRISLGDRIRVGSAVYVVELLDQAKAGLSKHWRESTRILMPFEAEALQPKPEEPSEECSVSTHESPWNNLRVWKRQAQILFSKVRAMRTTENMGHLRAAILSIVVAVVVISAILL